MTTAALIVAAGRGSRASRASALPKQYVEVGGLPILARTLQAFPAEIDVLQVVIHPDDAASYAGIAAWAGSGLSRPDRLLPPVCGGSTRQLSVLAGLEALSERRITRVLIHDAARPFVTAGDIMRVRAALDTSPGAILAQPLADTLKRADSIGAIAGTVPRDRLWRAQTPQAFEFERILEAHRQAAEAGITDLTDDAAVAERAGLPVMLVEGSPGNIKITTAEDIAMAEEALAPRLEPRTGSGYDVHRFTSGDHVMLGGIRIAHEQGLAAHSDGDVVLHALTDALLGAIGDGDIGQHFPPSDPKWKGAASDLFVEDAVRRVHERGGRIVNADITVLAEAPRIGPHREAIKARIAGMLGIDAARIGIKATTTEGLGFTGRREGIAAFASVMLMLP